MPKPKSKPDAYLSNQVILDRTGKPRAHWFALLDKAGARKMPHKEIALLLHKKHKLPAWWAQMVSVQYERERGLREVNQKCSGEFSLSKSVTLPFPVGEAYSAWHSATSRRAWLGCDCLEVTTANANKNIRGKWRDDSRIEVRFYPKAPNKTQVVLDHGKLADGDAITRWRHYWDEQMENYKQFVAKK